MKLLGLIGTCFASRSLPFREMAVIPDRLAQTLVPTEVYYCFRQLRLLQLDMGRSQCQGFPTVLLPLRLLATLSSFPLGTGRDAHSPVLRDQHLYQRFAGNPCRREQGDCTLGMHRGAGVVGENSAQRYLKVRFLVLKS